MNVGQSIHAIFRQCEFSYCSSSRLKLQMQSHIVRICTIFLQNWFSNGQIQSHIVCISSIFLQHELSNAPSDCLYERMQSCIGYIYAIFPQCEFSYGSSSRLKLQSHIVCIYVRFFSRMSFQMHPRTACMHTF